MDIFSYYAQAAQWIGVNYVPFLISYVAIGAVYVVLKWFHKLFRLRERIKSSTEARLEGFYDLTVSERKALLEKDSQVRSDLKWIAAKEFWGEPKFPPQFRNHKSLLTVIALFWPINLIWTAVGEIAVDIWKWFFNTVQKTMEYLTEKFLGV